MPDLQWYPADVNLRDNEEVIDVNLSEIEKTSVNLISFSSAAAYNCN